MRSRGRGQRDQRDVLGAVHDRDQGWTVGCGWQGDAFRWAWDYPRRSDLRTDLSLAVVVTSSMSPRCAWDLLSLVQEAQGDCWMLIRTLNIHGSGSSSDNVNTVFRDERRRHIQLRPLLWHWPPAANKPYETLHPRRRTLHAGPILFRLQIAMTRCAGISKASGTSAGTGGSSQRDRVCDIVMCLFVDPSGTRVSRVGRIRGL